MRRESDPRAPARGPILGERARQDRDVDATCTPKCYKLRSIWFIYAYFKPKFALLREQSCKIIDKYIVFLFIKTRKPRNGTINEPKAFIVKISSTRLLSFKKAVQVFPRFLIFKLTDSVSGIVRWWQKCRSVSHDYFTLWSSYAQRNRRRAQSTARHANMLHTEMSRNVTRSFA